MSNSARAWFAERLITCITDVSVTPVEVPVAPGVLCAFCKLVITHIGPQPEINVGRGYLSLCRANLEHDSDHHLRSHLPPHQHES